MRTLYNVNNRNHRCKLKMAGQITVYACKNMEFRCLSPQRQQVHDSLMVLQERYNTKGETGRC